MLYETFPGWTSPFGDVRSGWKGWCGQGIPTPLSSSHHRALCPAFVQGECSCTAWCCPVQWPLLRVHSLALLQIQPQAPAPTPSPHSYLCGATQALAVCGRGVQGDGWGGAAPLPCLCSASAACDRQEAATTSCKNLHVMGRRHRKVAWWPWGDTQVTPAASGQAGLWTGEDSGHLPTSTSKPAKVSLSLLSASWNLDCWAWGQQSSVGTAELGEDRLTP